MKVVKIKYTYNSSVHCYFHCPGCGYTHAFSPTVHEWNEDREKPTVRPSLLSAGENNYHRCHSYITEGRIEFLGDCWHELKGRMVDLPDFDVAQFDHEMIEVI